MPVRRSFSRCSQCALTLAVAILVGGCDAVERILNPPAEAVEVLFQLYEQLDGDDWTNNRNWLTNAPIGTWHGVTLDSGGNVTELDLSNNGLAGRIPPVIHKLEALESLDLAENDLTGVIPREIGALKSLVTLNLAGNSLTGPIPAELRFLDNLAALDLRDNRLTGPIPWELAALHNLEHLVLYGNLLSGELPGELGVLRNLRFLWIHGNSGLRGPIPPGFGNLRVADLDISATGLSGPLPLALMNVPLVRFRWTETDLCAPHDPAFRVWMGKIPDHNWGPMC